MRKRLNISGLSSGHRRYLVSSLEGLVELSPDRKVVLYCRVSTHSQKDDLETQFIELSQKVPDAEIIKEIGSRLNFKRKKFLILMQKVADS